MNSKLNIVDLGRDGLLDYTVKQISNLIPDGRHALIRPVLDRYFDEALERVRRCINAVKTWEVDRFYYLHSTQYCTYLYVSVRICTFYRILFGVRRAALKCQQNYFF